MKTADQSRDVRRIVLIGILVFIWLTALVFYWSVEATRQSNRHLLAGIILSYLALWGLVFFLSNTSKREIVYRFVLTSVSLALFVGFLELLVLAKMVDFRLVFSTPIHEPWRHPDNLMDPDLLHIRKRYLRFSWEGIDYRYDHYGFRNGSDFDAADVIVLGDSFIEGWGVSHEDLLTSHLAKQLSSNVVNLGQSWYGPQQELMVLRRYGLPLHPKACVWTLFEGNDLYDMRRYQEAKKDWEVFSKDFHSFSQRSFTKNVVLAVSRLLDSVHHRGRHRAAGPKNQSGIFEASPGRKARIHFWYQGFYLSAYDIDALKQLRLILGEACRMCQAIGAKFLVVFVPTKFRVYKGVTEFDFDVLPRYWVLNDLPSRVEAIVREELPAGEFLDLTPVLVEEAKRGALVYFPDDTHWSPNGHRVAATAIADFLMQWEENGVSVMP